MKNFWFCLNTKIYFGCGILKKHLGEISSWGKKVLIVTGRNSAKATGLLERVEKLLKDGGLKYVEFCEVEENPCFETVAKGAEIAKKNFCDCVLAMGGGSPLDAGKAIAVAATNKDAAIEYAGEDKFNKTPLPVIAIPTTSGTGSEITRFAVIVDEVRNVKKTIASLSIMPKMSICDPELTLSLPSGLTASTGMDVLAHAIEGYLSKKANPISDVLDIEAVRLGIANLKQAVNEPDNLEARERMMLACLTAGMALNHTGTIMAHGMGYVLTLDHGRQHGEASGIMLPYLLQHLYGRCKKRIDDIEQALGGDPGDVLKNLHKDIGLPVTLKEIGIKESRTDELTQRMIANAVRSVNNIDFEWTEDDFKQVIKRAFG